MKIRKIEGWIIEVLLYFTIQVSVKNIMSNGPN